MWLMSRVVCVWLLAAGKRKEEEIKRGRAELSELFLYFSLFL
jgi:hypothetical protein